jgi:hypothetical protein
MNRETILNTYKVNSNGVIQTPGKFEGEMLYVPYFWDAGLNGCASFDDGAVYGFIVDKEDREQFPELCITIAIMLEESSQGFVNSREFDSLAEYEDACNRLEESGDDDSF